MAKKANPDTMPDGVERRIEYRALDDIEANPSNPKAHDVGTINDSVARFGYIDGVVIDERTGYLISGHGRTKTLRAMRDRGEAPPDGVTVDASGAWLVPVQLGWASRTDAEAKAALIALNHSTELGGWVDESLLGLLDELSDGGTDATGLEGVGFDLDEIEDLRGRLAELTDEDTEPPGSGGAGEGPVKDIPNAKNLVTITHGNCLDVMATMADSSVDAIVTDPPYELGFMGKGWDSTGIAYNVELWRHALRVLKPGGHLVAFGGSRTWHRLATAVEDAGFEIRDSIAWLYGSGFPKSLDVSKAIDREAGVEREREEPQRRARQSDAIHHGGFGADGWAPQVRAAEQWQGWGTALKPAFEPIIVGRKPLSGTVAGNVLTHGTGALNIDGCRVAKSDDLTSSGGERVLSNEVCGKGLGVSSGRSAELAARWPANVVLDESQAADLDRQSGTSQSVQRTGKRTGKQAGILGEFPGQDEVLMGHSDEGGASRFFPTFRYEAKAPTAERPRDDGVAHPTVKPLDLMRWLVRLVTPPGGVVLEPFAGSGTTLEASVLEGFACIGIELEAAYLPLICQRLGLPEEHVRTSLDRLDTETGEKPVPSAR